MAFTSGSTTAMRPVRGLGGVGSRTTDIALAEDNAIAAGDVLILATQRVDEDNTNPTAANIVGVAIEASTAQDDEIKVALALPGQFFEANIIDSAVGDQTAAVAEDVNVKEGILQPADGYACVAQQGTTDCVRTIQYARQTGPARQFLGALTVPTETYAAGSTINPRVEFVFINGIFFG
jgi:hypothetical protein